MEALIRQLDPGTRPNVNSTIALDLGVGKKSVVVHRSDFSFGTVATVRNSPATRMDASFRRPSVSDFARCLLFERSPEGRRYVFVGR